MSEKDKEIEIVKKVDKGDIDANKTVLTDEDRELLTYVFKAARTWTVSNIADDEKSLLLMYNLKNKLLKL